MAKRSKKSKAASRATDSPIHPKDSLFPSTFRAWLSLLWLPLLLALVSFLIYCPSLKSDFVYDARKEILKEGFITSLSNLPAVLSLKVLGSNLMLASRPGELLYLMLIAGVCGQDPFGYHLGSILLHAANVALLFGLLHRLVAAEGKELSESARPKVQLSMAVVTLLFALHPIAVESVAEVSYSSSLLVTFFTLIALLNATFFRPEKPTSSIVTGTLGTLAAFAAVACKESGLAAALLLVVYWFLYRRREPPRPWALFLGAAAAITAAFLAVRFLFAAPGPVKLDYLGGSLSQVFWIQPRLWVFMMGKLLWPVHLSADYTLQQAGLPSASFALAVLSLVIFLQAWLIRKSRLGAFGVAIYWLGLVTVSNFIPLYRPFGDRFYYLPLAGVALQLLALLLMTLAWRSGFWAALLPLLLAFLPFGYLTLARQAVFANELALWSDTIVVSPLSTTAHASLGKIFSENGRLDEAVAQDEKALQITPEFAEIQFNLGNIFFQKGLWDQAIAHYQKAADINSTLAAPQSALGNTYMEEGRTNDAIDHFQKALELNPNLDEVQNNLGFELFTIGRVGEAISHYQKALELHPDFAAAHNNLGRALLLKGDVDDAQAQVRQALELKPNVPEAHNNLGLILLQKGQVKDALAQFQEALHLKPDYREARDNLALAKAKSTAPSGVSHP